MAGVVIVAAVACTTAESASSGPLASPTPALSYCESIGRYSAAVEDSPSAVWSSNGDRVVRASPPDQVQRRLSKLMDAITLSQSATPASLADEWSALAKWEADRVAAARSVDYDLRNPAYLTALKPVFSTYPEAEYNAIVKDGKKRCGSALMSLETSPDIDVVADGVPTEPPATRQPKTLYCAGIADFRKSDPGTPEERVLTSVRANNRYLRKLDAFLDSIQFNKQHAPTPKLRNAWDASLRRGLRYRRKLYRDPRVEEFVDLPSVELLLFPIADITEPLEPVRRDAPKRCGITLFEGGL